MLSELGVFDDIPRYLLSSDTRLREQALNTLRAELNRLEVRRPWGSIEPFIIALYHTVFINEDVEAGRLLLDYLSRVLPKVKNTLPSEAREIAEIVLYATRAKLGEIDVNSALKQIQKSQASTRVSELVKRIVIIELKGEYDEFLGDLLREVSSELEKRLQDLATLLNEHDSRVVAEYFLVDLDLALSVRELEERYSIRGYFTCRAKELQKEYEERRKIVDQVRTEYEELKQKYDDAIKKLSNQVKITLPIVIDIGCVVIVWLVAPFEMIIYSSVLSVLASVFALLYTIFRQLREKIVNLIISTNIISKIADEIAKLLVRCKKEGRELLKQLKYKEIVLRDYEVRLRRFR